MQLLLAPYASALGSFDWAPRQSCETLVSPYALASHVGGLFGIIIFHHFHLHINTGGLCLIV